MMRRWLVLLTISLGVIAFAAAAWPRALRAASPRIAQSPAPARGAMFVVYYWRAKPGQVEAYGEYITKTAEPIDMDAQRAGAFEEVRTVTPAPGTTADWTHLRMFRVKDAAAAQALGAALDAATKRIVPDEAQRAANSARAATLRDFVRQEVWAELR